MKNKFKLVYSALQRKRKKIKKRSIFLILFLFGVNCYAWFVYMSNANLTLSSTVSTWNVSFYDGDALVKELNIKTDNLYPGMNDYNREIIVKNNSDVNAEFSYEVDNITLFGKEIEVEDKINFLNNELPFTTTFNHDKTLMEKNDRLNFKININWLYEKEEEYTKLNSLYNYDKSFLYYVFTDGKYIEDTNVTVTNYKDKVANGLYILSDDADSYFGQKCQEYMDYNNTSTCFSFHLIMKVIQKNNE